MKFVHSADIHLDSPLVGLRRYERAPVDELRLAPRRAFAKLVDLCLQERVQFLLIAGDLFDRDWTDFGTGLEFVAQMARLCDADVPVIVLRGNHDAESAMSRSLKWPPNVRILASDHVDRVTYDHVGVAITGQSFATPDVRTNLARTYPAPLPGHFNIAMLHTALDGREGHAPYAPCALLDLIHTGYDYWALGHIHAHEIVHERPWIVFPGNLQGRHVREIGAKGACLVSVEPSGVTVTHHALDVVRWCSLVVESPASIDALLDEAYRGMEREVADACGRLVALRCVVFAEPALYTELTANLDLIEQQLRACALRTRGGRAWFERLRIELNPSASDSLHRQLFSTTVDDSLRSDLRAYISMLNRKLRGCTEAEAELRSADDPLDSLFDEARAWLNGAGNEA